MTSKSNSYTIINPGEVLTALIEKHGLQKIKVAADLQISRQHLYDIMQDKKPISVEIAVKLGKYFDTGTEYWSRMQMEKSVVQAEKEMDVSEIPTLKF